MSLFAMIKSFFFEPEIETPSNSLSIPSNSISTPSNSLSIASETRKPKRKASSSSSSSTTTTTNYRTPKRRKLTTKFKETTSMSHGSHPIALETLRVTQQSLRIERFKEIIHTLNKFKENGGNVNDSKAKLPKWEGKVVIFHFEEDGCFYLHDGHHRISALYAVGGSVLYPHQYVLIESTYEAMNQPWFAKCYVTPYDLKTEVRLAEFSSFKTQAIQLYDKGDLEATKAFIAKNRHQYCEKRSIHTLPELTEKALLALKASS